MPEVGSKFVKLRTRLRLHCISMAGMVQSRRTCLLFVYLVAESE